MTKLKSAIKDRLDDLDTLRDVDIDDFKVDLQFDDPVYGPLNVRDLQPQSFSEGNWRNDTDAQNVQKLTINRQVTNELSFTITAGLTYSESVKIGLEPFGEASESLSLNVSTSAVTRTQLTRTFTVETDVIIPPHTTVSTTLKVFSGPVDTNFTIHARAVGTLVLRYRNKKGDKKRFEGSVDELLATGLVPSSVFDFTITGKVDGTLAQKFEVVTSDGRMLAARSLAA